uniref:Uncharacterized protein n=1 Tax=Heterorhabditis bacteriophora TaxID=37862 RepID=A0A1I7WB04_HETBA
MVLSKTILISNLYVLMFIIYNSKEPNHSQ